MVDRPDPRFPAPPLLRLRDVFLVGYVPAMTLAARCLPEESWDALAALTVRLSGGARLGRRAEQARSVARLLAGRRPASEARRIVSGLAANHHTARLQLLGCGRRGAWRPRIAFAGRRHVEEALAAGRGGILWVFPLAFSDLVTKMAFHREGFRVAHLSRTGHGFSTSRFGARVLNPFWTSVECRYLGERCVMSPEASAGALRRVVELVRGNGLASVTVGAEGQRTRPAPFLGGRLRIADGAAALARRTGAALLPVFTVRTPEGGFVTTVEPPLRAAADLDVDRAVQSLVAQCAALLEECALRWPDQYDGWSLAVPTPPG